MRPQKIDPSLIKQIAGIRNLCIVLDYDGTLTPIVSRPSQAKLASGVRATLGVLSEMPGIRAAILSGRSLNDVERLVGIDSLDYVGNHGLERKIRSVVSLDPYAVKFREFISQLTEDLKRSLKNIPGILVEDKTYSLSVHYRNVASKNIPKARRIFNKAWDDFSAKIFFRIKPGKKVWEVRPAYGCSDKGCAVGLLSGSVPKAQGKNSAIVYLGDDVTDEDAFKTLKRSDFSIRVGYNFRTAARYWLRSPAEVAVFLKQLIEARKRIFSDNVQR
ncbi:MAG: trehalose-phosphatase [Candidatus Omnitrophota bacterium]